jgi:hypothetical protein
LDAGLVGGLEAVERLFALEVVERFISVIALDFLNDLNVDTASADFAIAKFEDAAVLIDRFGLTASISNHKLFVYLKFLSEQKTYL